MEERKLLKLNDLFSKKAIQNRQLNLRYVFEYIKNNFCFISIVNIRIDTCGLGSIID